MVDREQLQALNDERLEAIKAAASDKSQQFSLVAQRIKRYEYQLANWKELEKEDKASLGREHNELLYTSEYKKFIKQQLKALKND
jgi:hypothetical protein